MVVVSGGRGACSRLKVLGCVMASAGLAEEEEEADEEAEGAGEGAEVGGLKTLLGAEPGGGVAVTSEGSDSAGLAKLNWASPNAAVAVLPEPFFPLPACTKLKLGGVGEASSPCPTRRQEKLPSVSPLPGTTARVTAGLDASPPRGAADVSFTGSPDMAGGGVGVSAAGGGVGVGVGVLVLRPRAGEGALLLLVLRPSAGEEAVLVLRPRAGEVDLGLKVPAAPPKSLELLAPPKENLGRPPSLAGDGDGGDVEKNQEQRRLVGCAVLPYEAKRQ